MPRRLSLLFSHHILSTKKIHSITSLSNTLKLATLLKRGHPGLIVIEGHDSDVTQMTSDILVSPTETSSRKLVKEVMD